MTSDFDDEIEDVQCGRCGSSIYFEDCANCGGEGFNDHDCGEDSCCCLYPEDNVLCFICGGDGAIPICLASAEWCESHPMPGKEHVARSTPQYFRLLAASPESEG